MEKKCKVVLLPTDKVFNKKLNKQLIIHNGNLQFCQNGQMMREGQPQHLYILSDDEIKEGDWCIYNNHFVKYSKPSNSYFYKKIIATTNPDLIKEGIASIDDNFVKNYCNKPVEETWDDIYDNWHKTWDEHSMNFEDWMIKNYEVPKKLE